MLFRSFSHDSGRAQSGVQAQYTFGDVAILYRLNAQRHILEKAFSRAGIPFQVSGDKFYQTEGIFERQVEKVNFLTLHAAKGLEFPVVFIVGCEEHLLPLNWEGLESDLEEARRLFYVGMTRAKEMLFLTYAKHRSIFGKISRGMPCRFLADIEEQLKEYERSKNHLSRKRLQKSKQLNLFD